MQFDPHLASVVLSEGTLDRAVNLVEQWKDRAEAGIATYDAPIDMSIPTLVPLARATASSSRVA
jgi:hypothetical protein